VLGPLFLVQHQIALERRVGQRSLAARARACNRPGVGDALTDLQQAFRGGTQQVKPGQRCAAGEWRGIGAAKSQVQIGRGRPFGQRCLPASRQVGLVNVATRDRLEYGADAKQEPLGWLFDDVSVEQVT